MRIRQSVCFSGHVQGVGFRMNAVEQSRGLDVHGFVRNEPDGSVLMDVQGSRSDVQKLKERITTTMAGNIEDVVVEELPVNDVENGFRIRS